jgi:uncharacterized SAM-binding protein YcdF (DUF218 family)
MFFVLSKLLGFFAIPSNLVILIGIVGLLLLPTRFARAGRWFAFASLIVLAILGLSPIGNALIIPLEDRFPPWDAARGAPDGIIVLGGAIDAWGPRNERLVVVPELLRRYPNARILFSGGSGALIDDGDAEAKFAARLLESLGIARSRITLEDRSRNTVENGVFSKAIIQPKPGERWLLVTSAYHMPRAVGVFRKAGFPVEPYPVDWRTRHAEDALRPFATISEGLRQTDTALHEWVGLAVYWLTGRSSELFPAPTRTTARKLRSDAALGVSHLRGRRAAGEFLAVSCRGRSRRVKVTDHAARCLSLQPRWTQSVASARAGLLEERALTAESIRRMPGGC